MLPQYTILKASEFKGHRDISQENFDFEKIELPMIILPFMDKWHTQDEPDLTFRFLKKD